MLAFSYDTLDSTNTRAAELVIQYPSQPLLVTATTQTAGRGRNGRAWQSPAGGAWFSVALPVSAPPARTAAAPVVAGLALVEAIESLYPRTRTLQVKWPNDVLLDGCKLAGILCERTVQPTASVGHTVIVGVGVNANVPPADLGCDLRHPAASLQHALGVPVDVPGLIARAADTIAAALTWLADQGLTDEQRRAIARRLAWRDQRVRLQHGSRPVEGRLRGVDPDGRLLLECDDDTHAFDVGDVCRVERTPAVIQ